MPWKVLIVRNDTTYQNIDDVPTERRMPLGTRQHVIRQISSVFSGTQWDSDSWGTWDSRNGSIEFGIPKHGEVESVMLNVRGDFPLIPLIVKLAKENGWQAADCMDGTFIDQSEHPEDGLAKWLDDMNKLIDALRNAPLHDSKPDRRPSKAVATRRSAIRAHHSKTR